MYLSAIFAYLLVVTVSSMVAPQISTTDKNTPDIALKKELNHLLALIPVDQVGEIIVDYMAGDDAVKRMVNFTRSEEFKSIIKQVDAILEYRQTLLFLEGAGLPVYKYVNALHTALGVNSDFPASKTETGEAGIEGMLAALRNVIPTDKLIEAYLESSPELMTFVDRVRGDDIMKIFEKFQKIPEVQAAFQRGGLSHLLSHVAADM